MIGMLHANEAVYFSNCPRKQGLRDMTSFWKRPGVIVFSTLGFLPTLVAIYMALEGNFVGEPAARGECPSDGFTGCHTGALGFVIFSLFWFLIFAEWEWPEKMDSAWDNVGAGG